MSPLEGYGCSSEANTNLIKCLGGGGGGGSDSEEAEGQDHLVLVVGHQMADQEDDSRTTDQSVNEATTASTSLIKDATTDRHHPHQDRSNIIIDKDEKWLQLSIGGLTAADDNNHNLDIEPDNQSSPRESRPGMIELDLLPGSSSTNSEHELRLKSAIGLAPSPSMFHVPQFGDPPGPLPNIITSGAASSSSSNYYTTNTSLFMQQYPSSFPSSYHHHPHHHHGGIEFNWGALRPVQRNIESVSTPLSSSSSRLAPTAGPYLSRPFQLQLQSGLGLGAPRHSIDFRVVDPPRRPPSGIWFMLQASQNQ